MQSVSNLALSYTELGRLGKITYMVESIISCMDEIERMFTGYSGYNE
jgi:hypothetical protein